VHAEYQHGRHQGAAADTGHRDQRRYHKTEEGKAEIHRDSAAGK
jgi:hypothetical protein